MAHLVYRCYAKVNLSLEVVARRLDGFHELASLVHTVSLADDLRITPADELLTRVEGLTIEPEANLIWRAARLLAQATGERRGAELTLVKGIPAAAGLGGGSSDAASTLVGLNRFWGHRLRLHDLEALAAELGSDVPFFVRGGAALMQGRGEALKPLAAIQGQWLVLLVPPHDVADKTRRLYAALQPSDFSNGEISQKAAQSLLDGASLQESELVNGFKRAACEVFVGLTDVWRDAEQRCGKRFHLSGAGPAIFALARDRTEASACLQKLGGMNAYAVRTVKHARASIAIAP
jgi:4-diphosphocytidyl-2-C-methyl-D-erythritol kinase